MPYTPTPLESIARETLLGLMDEIEGYTTPFTDGMLAPWMMAEKRAESILRVIREVCTSISARPALNPGQQALRAIATNTAAEDEAMDEMESRAFDAAWNRKHPDLAQLLEETKEARMAVLSNICPAPRFPSIERGA